ncbi:MAG: ABC transporter ATP-binding protein [Clostridiaceae bacterium]|nr:ABC transporter ATP-binding protein [Clostridiaceae bacterium]
MLDVRDLTVRYGDLTILDRISFQVNPGDWLMIIGPNGAGKSTIIHAVSQVAPYQGEILLKGRNIRDYKAGHRAQLLGVLTQHHPLNYPFSVEEVIRLGRYAYAPWIFSRSDDEGEAYIQRAIEQTGLGSMLKQSILTLSGGEIQRVFLAQLFAQNPNILILDEPANHLDLVYQKQTFGLLKDWLKKPDRAIVSVVHDLGPARAYGERALLLNKGKVEAQGPIGEVLTEANLNRVYGMDVFAWMRNMLGQWQN